MGSLSCKCVTAELVASGHPSAAHRASAWRLLTRQAGLCSRPRAHAITPTLSLCTSNRPWHIPCTSMPARQKEAQKESLEAIGTSGPARRKPGAHTEHRLAALVAGSSSRPASHDHKNYVIRVQHTPPITLARILNETHLMPGEAKHGFLQSRRGGPPCTVSAAQGARPATSQRTCSSSRRKEIFPGQELNYDCHPTYFSCASQSGSPKAPGRTIRLP